MPPSWNGGCDGRTMDKGLVTLIGMSIAYVASFLGMGLAWWSWRRRQNGGGE
jgi:hypothetical protein